MPNEIAPGGQGGYTGNYGAPAGRGPVYIPPDVAQITPSSEAKTAPKTAPKPAAGDTTSIIYINGNPYTAVKNANGDVISLTPIGGSASNTTSQFNPNVGGGSGTSSAMTAYEQQQVALDQQRLKDAEAQQAADQVYRDAQAVDTWTKNWQDFQTKNHYGSMAGPAYAAPAGSPWWFKMPEPSYIADWYKNNPSAGPDPWNLPSTMSGYSGSGASNPQQPGLQNAGLPGGPGTNPQIGNTPAPIAGASTPATNVPASQAAIQGAGYAAASTPTPTPTTMLPPGALAAATSSAGAAPATGATTAPVPLATPAQITPTIPNFDKGGTVQAPLGTPQVAIVHGGEQFSGLPQQATPDTQSQSQVNVHPAIGNLLAAVNALLSNPDIQGLSKVPISTGMASYATGGIVPDDLTPTPTPQAQATLPPTPGVPTTPNPGIASFSQPTTANSSGFGSFAQSTPPPNGTSSQLMSRDATNPISGFTNPTNPSPFGTPTGLGQPTPITPAPENVLSGPMAQNHVPYGPELTGLDQLGGLITPNGTPVPLSMWQLAHLDPTSLSNYQNYIDSIAGWNSADLQSVGKLITGPADGINFSAPRKWNPIDITPAPAGG